MVKRVLDGYNNIQSNNIVLNARFNIEIKTNLHIVDFLDVTFNLLDGTYKPYKKQNDQILYVNTHQNIHWGL